MWEDIRTWFDSNDSHSLLNLETKIPKNNEYWNWKLTDISLTSNNL
jgi:hypothetical protein